MVSLLLAFIVLQCKYAAEGLSLLLLWGSICWCRFLPPSSLLEHRVAPGLGINFLKELDKSGGPKGRADPGVC